MPDPTPRQLAILALLWREALARRSCPTIRDIGAAIGLRSTSSTHWQLGHLEAAGLIDRALPSGGRNRIERAIRITEAGHLALGRRWRFPVRGTVG